MTPTDPKLMDRESSWWAKYRHAESHLQRLDALYDSYYESQPFKIEEEHTDQPQKLAARLHVQPIPPEIPPGARSCCAVPQTTALKSPRR
jgi:hypothetical protein